MLFLLEAFLRIAPDEPDDLAGDELGVEAEQSCDPGDRLPLVRGGPQVPADQVVQQEWNKKHRSPGHMFIGEERYEQGGI